MNKTTKAMDNTESEIKDKVKQAKIKLGMIVTIVILSVLLVIALILLLKKELCPIGYNKLMGILTGTATLLSIVLACFSIAFSYHSSNVLDEKTANIEKSVYGISEVCKHLDNRYSELSKGLSNVSGSNVIKKEFQSPLDSPENRAPMPPSDSSPNKS